MEQPGFMVQTLLRITHPDTQPSTLHLKYSSYGCSLGIGLFKRK
jgi:hypothetical protein